MPVCANVDSIPWLLVPSASPTERRLRSTELKRSTSAEVWRNQVPIYLWSFADSDPLVVRFTDLCLLCALLRMIQRSSEPLSLRSRSCDVLQLVSEHCQLHGILTSQQPLGKTDDGAEPSRAEPSRAEPSRAEPSVTLLLVLTEVTCSGIH